MKTYQSRRKAISLSKTRWAAYTVASAATTLASSSAVEAAIHYSGRLESKFLPDQSTTGTFQLDQTHDFLFFRHLKPSKATFKVYALLGYGFRGYGSGFGDQFYVSKLSFGADIAAGPFFSGSLRGILARYDIYGQWRDKGVGFIGFKFNNGAGFQYGWARVKMTGSSGENGFKVLDYAYADLGESITAGQRSDHEMVTDEGSLSWLALGATGLIASREARSGGAPTAVGAQSAPLIARQRILSHP